ncbi:MAG: peptidase M22 [Ruminococcus sp.]|nr:peptidase M22 [Ruminococcus sp.]
MSEFLGIDTSNYTTSVAIYDSAENKVYQSKKLLPVRNGQLGLRQSDAVFHHTKQLPEMIEKLFSEHFPESLETVSVSVRPRNVEGSYMPCFLCGESLARAVSSVQKIPLYTTSHQVGHILAGLYSADCLNLVNEKFIAFHVSGGTTDCLLCETDCSDILKITEVGTSLDLKAGQAVDRVGLMLGLKFPCGIELEKLAYNSDRNFKVKAVLKDNNCCLSGLENKCRKMLDDGEKTEDVAKYCLDFVTETVISMTEKATEIYGNLPLVFVGGVMSDKIIRNKIISRFGKAHFAEPEFSCDNATGTAIYGYLKSRKHNKIGG